MDKRVVIASLVSGIVGAAAGGAVTYFTVKKTIEERANRDIEDVKRTYAERFEGKRVVNAYGNMPGGPEVDPETGRMVPDPTEEVVQTPFGNMKKEDLSKAQDFVQRLGYQTPVPNGSTPVVVEEETTVKTVSVFDREDPTEDIGKEVTHVLLRNYDLDGRRIAHKPYLISEEDFNNTETEWDKASITYFEGDDILTDEKEQVVTDIDYLIGEVHLDFFGIWTGDKNQMYVRAPQISTDFEVTRNLGHYTEVILGIPAGSEKSAVRRMREGDDD